MKVNSNFVEEVRYAFLEYKGKRIQERVRIIFKNGRDIEYLVGLSYNGVDGEIFYNNLISANPFDEFYKEHLINIEKKILKR